MRSDHRDDSMHGRVGDTLRTLLRSPVLIWTVAAVVAFLWSSAMVGVGIALADKRVAGWWVLVIPAVVGPGLLLWATARFLGIERGRLGEPAGAPTEPPKRPVPSTGVAGDGSSAPEGGDLTDREREVLVLLGSGKTQTEIAKELYVAPGTVKAHVHNIYRKLGARNRTEALARARDLRLVP
jgi:DNA-binding CsgD family transcriptional regulator